MQSHSPTTPFGRRSLTLAHVASQMVATCTSTRKGGAQMEDLPGDLRRAAKAWRLGTLAHGSECSPDVPSGDGTKLDGCSRKRGLIVFPSNQQLLLRAHGMPASTLRRHLAVLVDAGLIIRRDSPNGKRYARKDSAGEIELAFGFDLSPLVVTCRRVREPGGRDRRGCARAQAGSRTHHALPARHRQDDRNRHRGGRANPSGKGRGPPTGRKSISRFARSSTKFHAPLRGRSSSRSLTSCRSSRTTSSIFWKHTSKPQI